MSGPVWLKESQASVAAANGQPSTSKLGQWQALGVQDSLAKNLLLRGFKAPTPIQRSTIPLSLSSPPRDVLGMARTGSGKTLAYIIPLIQRLGGRHSSSGPRSLILCPTRELALQILKVGKDLARGKSGGKGPGQEPLRWAVVIGGTGLDDQFEAMSDQPDVVIATPGRFLHLAVEMKLDMREVITMIYDEADRLFEMGFAVQLQEIVHRLPPTRQNLLFSATLPTSVAEFATANLTNPALVRLDADANLSPDLDVGFLYTKPQEKDAALLVLLRQLLPRGAKSPSDERRQAIIFTATKHHVEYISNLLLVLGYDVSQIYGSLDQVARQRQLQLFRDRATEVLVVTDVAARGLDIPVMDNVVNYDFPSSSRIFIHRVGRTARAGRKGSAISLVTRDDLPYLVDLDKFLDLHLFSPLSGRVAVLPVSSLDEASDSVRSVLEQTSTNLQAARTVMQKGQTMYERSRSKASQGAYRQAKAHHANMSKDGGLSTWQLSTNAEAISSESSMTRSALLHSLQQFQPAETILENSNRGNSANSLLMRQRRERLGVSRKHRLAKEVAAIEQSQMLGSVGLHSAETVAQSDTPVTSKSFRDPDFFIAHERPAYQRDKGYSVTADDNFAGRLQSSTLDLVQDEASQQGAQKASHLKWDKSKKRFIAGSGVGADNKKMIRTESGALLPASFNSGRYDQWKKERGRGRAQLVEGSEQSESSKRSRNPKPVRPSPHRATFRRLDTGHVSSSSTG